MRLHGPDRVIERPDELDADVVASLLAEAGRMGPGAEVRAITVEPVGTGQMADTVRIRLDGEGVPDSLVAKFASSDETSRTTGKMMRAYEIEVSFYAELAERLSMRVPTALFCALDDEAGTFTLLLEDIVGATQGDQIAGCTVAQARACLEDLAGLHGPCWEDPEVAAMGWLARGGPDLEAFTASVVQGVFPGFLDRYAERLTEAQVGLLEGFIPRMTDWYAAKSGPRTAIHCDFRLDNLLFAPGDSRPVVVDFQTAVWGSAADDLAYFLGGNLTAEDRRAAEESLISDYLDLLVTTGVEGYGREEIDRSYRLGTFAGVVLGVGAAMLVQRTDRGDEMFLCSVGRHADHALDLDALHAF
jgi:hypothetical protein